MTRQNFRDAANSQNSDEPGAFKIPPTIDQRRRLASLIAVGEAPIPTEIPSATLEALLAEVAHLRRARLRRFIIRVIALDISTDLTKATRKRTK